MDQTEAWHAVEARGKEWEGEQHSNLLQEMVDVSGSLMRDGASRDMVTAEVTGRLLDDGRFLEQVRSDAPGVAGALVETAWEDLNWWQRRRASRR